MESSPRSRMETETSRISAIAEQYAREWHLKQEKEKYGLVVPEAELRSARASTLPLVEQFLASLKADGRSKDHVSNVSAHLKRLLSECGWKLVQDILPASFTGWKVTQEHRAPKTLNEFLGSAKHFCTWLVDQGKTSVNPLGKIKRVPTKGRQHRQRRALSIEELTKLLSVSGKRKLVYAFAFYTGVRRGELEQLLLSDIERDKTGLWVSIRPEISKNRNGDRLPIHPSLVALLEEHLKERKGAKMLFKSIPRCDTLREDLKRAGIPYKDERGQQADFHALRKATSTHLGAHSAAPRAQMGMLRHSDPRLTLQTYTDDKHIQLREAVEKLPDVIDPGAWTHQWTHGTDVSGHEASQAVGKDKSVDATQVAQWKKSRRELAGAVALGRKARKAAALGLEPRTPCSRGRCATNCTTRQIWSRHCCRNA